MCGRFALYSDLATVTDQFSLTHGAVLSPRYNIAPSQPVPIIRTPGVLDFLTWGLRPKWLKSDRNAFINARMETLQEKPAFKQAFKIRRCLLLSNGYYEWRQAGNIKQPYFVCLPQAKLFAFAGIWEEDTCAIITKPADQPEIRVIHDRMPVVINPDDYALWINPHTELSIVNACMHKQDYLFTAAPVSTKVNNPKNDFVECIFALH